MPFVQLRRNAPEVRDQTQCCVCGVQDGEAVQDHLLVGTPGTPSQNAALCEHCGRVLEQVVQTVGSELSVQVQHAQQEATERDTPAVGRKEAEAANPSGAQAHRARPKATTGEIHE